MARRNVFFGTGSVIWCGW